MILPAPLDAMMRRRIIVARLLYGGLVIGVALLVAHQFSRKSGMWIAGEIIVAATVPVVVAGWIQHIVLRLWKMPGLYLPAVAEVPAEIPLADVRWSEGEAGRSAAFTYIDADGVVTDRRVVNWQSDGPYIRAHCLTRRAGRTFRKERVVNWVA